MAYEVSDRFKAAVTASYQVAAEAEIMRGGVVVATDLRVTGGSISVARSADVRRTCRLTVVGVPRELIPTSRQRTPLDIYGNELVIRAGIRYPDGSSELVPQGVFTITDSELVDTSDGVEVALQGSDRAERIGESTLLEPWATANGTDAVSAITALAQDRYPLVEIVNLTSATDTFPAHILEEKASPWADGIWTFAAAVGAETYFDRSGRLTIRDVPDPTVQPVAWQLVEGPRCTVKALRRTYSKTHGGVNAVVMIGEGVSTVPVRAVAYDLDPESPTYWYGDYPQRPTWEQSSLITTTDQAQAAADARGRGLFGLTEQVTVTCVPNYAVDEGDLLYVRRERSGFDDVVIVDSISLPVDDESDMQMTCWLRRTVS